MTSPRLLGGRLAEHDEASRDYRAAPAPVRSVEWEHHGRILDQRNSHGCVGFAFAQACNTGPLHTGRLLDETDALGIYGWGTRLDGYVGNTYPMHDLGTSVLAGAKAARKLGKIGRWDNAFGGDNFCQAMQRGPVVLGTAWHEGMDHPDSHGIVTVDGPVRMHHAYVARKLDLEAGLVTVLLAWGDDFGEGGEVLIPLEGIRSLLDDDHDSDALLPLR